MAITQTLTDTFKQDCLDGAQNLGNGGNTLKIALYTSSASSVSYTHLTLPTILRV